MTVGMKIARRCTVFGRVYGVGVYPRGVPDEHAEEIQRLRCGEMIPEVRQADASAPAAAGGEPEVADGVEVTDAMVKDKKLNPKRLSKKSLAQKLRREAQKRREDSDRQRNEQALAAELNAQPVEVAHVAAVTDTEIAAIQALDGPLPEDIPGRKLYEAGGVADLKTLVNLPTEELLKVPGVTTDLIDAGRAHIIALVRANQAQVTALAAAVAPPAPVADVVTAPEPEKSDVVAQ